MTGRSIERRDAVLHITLRADPSALRYAVRDAGLDPERVDVTPPMDELDEPDGDIEVSSLTELAAEFIASVGEKLDNMAEWIAEKEHVTEKQEQAIENMIEAAGKWLR